jgi:hypothetical protein
MEQTRPSPALWALLAGLLAFAVYHFALGWTTPYNHYVLLADAFLHGRVDIALPGEYLEAAEYRGRFYVLNPPFPAVLLIPYVALRGTLARQEIISQMAGAAGAVLLLLAAARIMPRPRDYLWLGALAAFGTILWYLSAVGSTWYMAHVVGAAALSLGVWETLGRRRPSVLGLAVGAAYLCRYPSIMTVLFFALATLPVWAPGGLRRWRQIDLAYLIWLAAPIAAALALHMLYNWARFETLTDIAQTLRKIKDPWFARGLLDLSYIPAHLDILFRARPVLIPEPPYALIPWWGLAIWVTTPAFVFALRAPLTLETVGAWLAVCVVAFLNFLWGTTGWTQFGYRFIADIYPLLFLLTVRGMRGRVGPLAKTLIVACVLVNAWGVLGTRWGWLVR